MDLHKMYWNLFTSSLKVHVREKVFSFQLDTKHDMKIIGQRLNAMKNNQLFWLINKFGILAERKKNFSWNVCQHLIRSIAVVCDRPPRTCVYIQNKERAQILKERKTFWALKLCRRWRIQATDWLKPRFLRALNSKRINNETIRKLKNVFLNQEIKKKQITFSSKAYI